MNIEAMIKPEEKAAAQYGTGTFSMSVLGHGLIHRTYLVEYNGHEQPLVLQCLNQNTFPQPENIIRNYITVYNHLIRKSGTATIPELALTLTGKLFYIDEDGNFWRATKYLAESFTLNTPENAWQVRSAAIEFGTLTFNLSDLDTNTLDIVLPSFHDLTFRVAQFEQSVKQAGLMRSMRATHVIAELRARTYLHRFYTDVVNTPQSFRKRVMHHDAKLSNVLFHKTSGRAFGIVDLDTTMPGYFFSDVGDMIRTMAARRDENSMEWEHINVNGELYRAIVEGYAESLQGELTAAELDSINYSGLVLTYMQSMRFVTDFLNNDIYYKTISTDQNLNRALNQLILLEKLEEFTGISA
jgi:hypothetical protein